VGTGVSAGVEVGKTALDSAGDCSVMDCCAAVLSTWTARNKLDESQVLHPPIRSAIANNVQPLSQPRFIHPDRLRIGRPKIGLLLSIMLWNLTLKSGGVNRSLDDVNVLRENVSA
jgi:hypothetical protein